ncbi:NAD-dependent epimerase/dehydratase family protein [Nocardia sp. BMG51109]|uniref:NAD-dependent epimerase/dehydratase family protein n=1 Tax=Nocardia sp. BMG51109 TaxID=1056816 RepID=UPI0004B0A7BB|nr:NAD-dependent epimerase/dehydratase family protein [Nocardia sp. BMG51109]
MKVLIIGGSGFLGLNLATSLVRRGYLFEGGRRRAIDEVLIFDLVRPSDPVPDGVRVVLGDVRDAVAISSLLTDDVTSVFYLASMMSAESEHRWDAAYDCNVSALRGVLNIFRERPAGRRFVFSSSVAALRRSVGAEAVRDPLTTYGTTKAMCELLIEDASRMNIIDARVARLPTVVVRPGSANRAASGFASNIFRDCRGGRVPVVPVGVAHELLVIGVIAAVESMVMLHDVDRDSIGPRCTVNLRGITVSVNELLAEATRRYGSVAREALISVDPSVERIIGSWPVAWSDDGARSMGLPFDLSLRHIVDSYDGVAP